MSAAELITELTCDGSMGFYTYSPPEHTAEEDGLKQPRVAIPDRPARPGYASRPLSCGTAWYTELLTITSSLLHEISILRLHASYPAPDTTRQPDEHHACLPSRTFHAFLKGNTEDYIKARTQFFTPTLTRCLKDMFESHDMFPSFDRIVGASEGCFEIALLQSDERTASLLEWGRSAHRPRYNAGIRDDDAARAFASQHLLGAGKVAEVFALISRILQCLLSFAIKRQCYGCLYMNPSQKHHTCLKDLPWGFLQNEDVYDYVRRHLFTEGLAPAIGHLLGLDHSSEKFLGIADVCFEYICTQDDCYKTTETFLGAGVLDCYYEYYSIWRAASGL